MGMAMTFFDDIVVVLVDTLYGGNLGSVCRSMANFGLTELRLVRPAKGIFDDPLLEPMARGQALPILKNVQIFDTLEEALADVDVALGFTTRLGKRRRDGLDLHQAVRELAEEEVSRNRIAGVFGSEDKGLNNSDLEKCQWLVRIPTAPTLSSLNLAQAVGLFAYETHVLKIERTLPPPAPRKTAKVAEMEGLYQHVQQVLEAIDFFEEETPERMMNEMRRMISRRLPEPRDVRILRGVLSKIEQGLTSGIEGGATRKSKKQKQ
jgi:TrmH family RNA methyltransferase